MEHKIRPTRINFVKDNVEIYFLLADELMKSPIEYKSPSRTSSTFLTQLNRYQKLSLMLMWGIVSCSSKYSAMTLSGFLYSTKANKAVAAWSILLGGPDGMPRCVTRKENLVDRADAR